MKLKLFCLLIGVLIIPVKAGALTPEQIGVIISNNSLCSGCLSPWVYEPPPPSPSPCDSIETDFANAVMDVDAACSSSTDGISQTWANLVQSPNDGAAQTDYDVWVGATSGSEATDPTFNGSAGSTSAYWSVDGGDYFNFKNVSSPTTIYNLHKKTGGTNVWTIAWAGRYGTDVAQAPWGRGDSGNTYGMYLYKTSTTATLYQDYASTFTGLSALGPDTGTGTDYLIILSVDMEATTNNVKMWVNTETGTSYSKTWTSTSTNTSRTFRIGGSVNSAGSARYLMTNGGRIYGFWVFDKFLSDADVSIFADRICARHNINFTGSCL